MKLDRYLLLSIAVVGLSVVSHAADNPPRYLPADLGLDGIDDITYNSTNFTYFDQNVTDCGNAVGNFKFDYNTWKGKSGGSDTGGAAIAGTFTVDKTKWKLKAGCRLGWVQTVLATIPGDTGKTLWGATPGNYYPDTKTKADPDYPYEYLPGDAPQANPTDHIGFQDFPNRYPSDGDQVWLAQLGLCCKCTDDKGNNTCNIIGTFLWGFDVKKGGNPFITPSAPAFWGPPTQAYMDTLTNSFDGKNGSTKWTFSTDQCCFEPAPEPSSLALLLTAPLSIVCMRRRRK